MHNRFLEDFLEIVNDAVEGNIYIDPIEIEGDKVTSLAWIADPPEEYDIPSDHDGTMALCKAILRRVLEFPLYEQKQNEHIRNLENYINDFAHKLKSEWRCFKAVSLQSLPVYITDSHARDDNGKLDVATMGTHRPFSGLISIYGCNAEKPGRDMETARHETIHYLLAAAGLPFSDDCALFWFFATIYDAGPYKEMDAENKRLYEQLIHLYKNSKEDLDKMFISLIDAIKTEQATNKES